MTLREYIYAVKNPPNGGMTNRASEVGERLVAQWINKYRNFLVAQDIKRTGEVDSSLEQDLGCQTLTKADAALCSRYKWCESVYYVDIPALLEVPGNMGLTYFGLVSKQDRINVSDYSYGRYTTYNRFSPRKPYGELIGSRIYVHGLDDEFPLEAVNIRGVWANPYNLVTESSPTTPIKCFDWDKDQFPMLTSMDSILFDLIYTKELNISFKAITDKKDDDVTDEKL